MTGLAASPERLKERLLGSNIESLGIRGKTKQAILGACSKGRLVRLSDGNPVVEVDGKILGAPAEARSGALSLADVEGTLGGIAVVFGMGAGHAVRELRERSSAKLVVFEPDPGVLRMVLESGPSDLGGIPIVCDPLDLQEIWTDLAREHASAAMVHTPGYQSAYPDSASALAETVRMLVADVSLFENTRAFRFREWIEDVLANLDVLCEATPFMALARQYQSVPAFIVGAGPSLTKNAPLLREAAKKGIVFAVDMSGKVLATHGVEPQVLVCLEALSLSDHIRSLPFIDRVVRAFSLTASPKSLATGRGPLLPFFEMLRAFTPLEELAQVPPVSVGGSVSTVAFSIAEKLGCSPVVLIGQDLAYTDGRTHAQGTAFEGSRTRVDRESGTIVYDLCREAVDVRKGSHLGPPQTREPLFEVVAWGGSGTAVSTSAFNAYRKWFEGARDAIHTVRPDVVFVNATEGGSRIRGFAERTLAEVLSDLPEQSITSESLAAAAAAARPPLEPRRIAEWADSQAALARDAGKAAARLSRTVVRGREYLKGEDPKAIGDVFRDLARAEEAVRKACAEQPLLDGWSYAQMHNLMLIGKHGAPKSDTRAEAAWGLETEAQLAEVIAKGADELAQELTKVADRMRKKILACQSHVQNHT